MLLLGLLHVAPFASIDSALGRWIEAEGGFIGGNVAIRTLGGRRGLYVTEAVNAGAVLARVPKSCLIFAEESDLQPAWGLSLAEFLTANLGGAKSRGEKTPYMDSLPAAEALLADWEPAELAMLQSPRLEREARLQAEHRRTMVSRVAKWVPTADAAMLGWAETMARSRALTFESGWKGSALMCMVPFVDLANHRVPLPDEVPCFPVDLVRSFGEECVVSSHRLEQTWEQAVVWSGRDVDRPSRLGRTPRQCLAKTRARPSPTNVSLRGAGAAGAT